MRCFAASAPRYMPVSFPWSILAISVLCDMLDTSVSPFEVTGPLYAPSRTSSTHICAPTIIAARCKHSAASCSHSGDPLQFGSLSCASRNPCGSSRILCTRSGTSGMLSSSFLTPFSMSDSWVSSRCRSALVLHALDISLLLTVRSWTHLEACQAWSSSRGMLVDVNLVVKVVLLLYRWSEQVEIAGDR